MHQNESTTMQKIAIFASTHMLIVTGRYCYYNLIQGCSFFPTDDGNQQTLFSLFNLLSQEFRTNHDLQSHEILLMIIYLFI